MVSIVDVGAAPHCPAGHFSPYSDGEKGLAAASAHILQRWILAKTIDDSAPLPVTIRGEDAGRQVRGSAIVDVGAAPHCPAGHFSPYSDGEKDAGLTAELMFFTEKKHLPPLSE
ncbi:hypothetical protein X737_25150 [Mesorhizobium sp. L48C026A00]|nr:hypothetical protein X737_25150 [Mesorhizobium sp. L48C026A00]